MRKPYLNVPWYWYDYFAICAGGGNRETWGSDRLSFMASI